MAIPTTDLEFRQFIASFEEGTIPKEDWRHSAHVAVAFWYLTHFDEESAIGKIRQGIQNLNKKHNVPQTRTGGYHDTWTIFFAKILKKHISEEFSPEASVIEQMNCAITFLADFKGMTRKYYSEELIMSWEARIAWQEPDLKPL